MLATRSLQVPDATSAMKIEATLVFTDVVDFTPMTRKMGDLEAYELMSTHRRLVRAEVERHRGEEVELLGDGFLLRFPDPDRALDCAIAIQRGCEALRTRDARWPLRVRIGIHSGSVLRDGDRLFGQAVIRCARISARAGAGEILVSRESRERTRRHRDRLGQPRWVRLKGFGRSEPLFHAQDRNG